MCALFAGTTAPPDSIPLYYKAPAPLFHRPPIPQAALLWPWVRVRVRARVRVRVRARVRVSVRVRVN